MMPAPVPVSWMVMPLMVLPELSVTAAPDETANFVLPLPLPINCSPLASVMPVPE